MIQKISILIFKLIQAWNARSIQCSNIIKYWSNIIVIITSNTESNNNQNNFYKIWIDSAISHVLKIVDQDKFLHNLNIQ